LKYTCTNGGAEVAFSKHVYARYYKTSIGLSYWRHRAGHEVDVIAGVGGRLVPSR
jgi:hypothetical protein